MWLLHRMGQLQLLMQQLKYGGQLKERGKQKHSGIPGERQRAFGCAPYLQGCGGGSGEMMEVGERAGRWHLDGQGAQKR